MKRYRDVDNKKLLGELDKLWTKIPTKLRITVSEIIEIEREFTKRGS